MLIRMQSQEASNLEVELLFQRRFMLFGDIPSACSQRLLTRAVGRQFFRWDSAAHESCSTNYWLFWWLLHVCTRSTVYKHCRGSLRSIISSSPRLLALPCIPSSVTLFADLPVRNSLPSVSHSQAPFAVLLVGKPICLRSCFAGFDRSTNPWRRN